MLYLIFFLIDLSLAPKVTPDAVLVKKADIELNQLIIDKNVGRAADFYADDFILTTAAGSAKYKQDLLTEIGSQHLSLEINETSHVEVRIVGTTAVLTGVLHQKGIYKGKAFDVFLLVTDTWVQTRAGWKILSGHASPQPLKN